MGRDTGLMLRSARAAARLELQASWLRVLQLKGSLSF